MAEELQEISTKLIVWFGILPEFLATMKVSVPGQTFTARMGAEWTSGGCQVKAATQRAPSTRTMPQKSRLRLKGGEDGGMGEGAFFDRGFNGGKLILQFRDHMTSGGATGCGSSTTSGIKTGNGCPTLSNRVHQFTKDFSLSNYFHKLGFLIVRILLPW